MFAYFCSLNLTFVATYRVLQKKQPSCQTHCEETCIPPFPQFNVVISLCLKGLQKNSHFGSDAGMHWATTLIKGARGIRCDMTTCRRMAVFFWRTRYSHSILPRCSMYGIFTYIWVMFGVHVDTYSRTTEHLGGNQDIITITPKNTVYTLQLQTPRLRLYLKGFNLGVCLHLLRGYLEH